MGTRMETLSLSEMPILSELVHHVERSHLPLHVPGHKQGRLLPEVLGKWLGAACKLDLTELPGLDNLHLPTGCIRESQEHVAAHYGADRCFYSINGSTAGVIAALLTLAGNRGKVLFLNSPHLSAWRALVLADAEAVFAPVRFTRERLTEQAPSVEGLAERLQREHFDCVFVTSPIYTGAIAPIGEIVKLAHRQGIPVIVDEAHGAHLGLHPKLPPHSVALGADIVIHSTHKMLPGLTQTAWVLSQDQLVDPHKLAQHLSLLQSTSPSYLLLASLDATQAWLRIQGPKIVEDGMKSLHSLTGLPHRQDGDPRDPFRDWIATGSLGESQALQKEFARRGIVVEYADAFGVLSIFGLDAPVREVAAYRDVAEQWFEKASAPVAQASRTSVLFHILEHERRPLGRFREAYFDEATWVMPDEAVGRLCAQPVTPYPPGVPLVWPGQEITWGVLEALRELRQGGYEVHGLGANGELPILPGF